MRKASVADWLCMPDHPKSVHMIGLLIRKLKIKTPNILLHLDHSTIVSAAENIAPQKSILLPLSYRNVAKDRPQRCKTS
jgi:hypothetical protein